MPALLGFAVMLVIAGFIARKLPEVPKVAAVLLFVAAPIAAIGSAIAIVPAGHVGVPVLFGKVQGRALPEGLNIVVPFVKVHQMSVRIQMYTMSIAAREGQRMGDDSITVLTADGLQMPLDISVAYHLEKKDAPWMFRHIGPDYEDTIIRSAARTAIREAASQFTAQEAYSSKREALAAKADELLRARVDVMLQKEGQQERKGAGIVIQQVLLRNLSLPQRVRTAIEEKLAAEQEVQRMEFVKAKEQKEAERKEIEAQGIAKFQKIVAEGISDPLLRWRGIEATKELAQSPNAKVVIIGSGEGGLPIILNPGQ
ncbi:MAG: prohibitin family protein [Planctomycetota bacterium]|jgi:regulator of protease activity HflC (stomatin/prohibitin superfamily)